MPGNAAPFVPRLLHASFEKKTSILLIGSLCFSIYLLAELNYTPAALFLSTCSRYFSTSLSVIFALKKLPSKKEGHVHQCNQHRHLYKGTDDCSKGGP